MVNPIILITGANGFIGTSLVKHFCAKGWGVRALVHHLPADKVSGVEYAVYNMEDLPSENIFEGAQYLAHCAYVKYDRNKNSDKINIRGTQMLIDICRKYKIKPVFLSSFSAHEQAQSHYGKNKLRLESLFASKTDLVLKPGLVTGNGGLFATIQEVVGKRKFIPLAGGGRQPVQTIFIDDLSRIIEVALEKKICGIYKVAEPEAITMRQLYELIAEKQKRNPRFVPVPVWFLLMTCRIAESLSLKLPVTSENVLGLKQLRRFETKDDLRVCGVTVKTFRESLDILIP
jgi:nucleoside-diphosphate-sugar epimerase